MKRFRRALASIASTAVLLAPACWAAAGADASATPMAIVAVVDGSVISAQEFDNALATAIRQKFYHRRPPEDQLAALRQEVTDGLVNRALLLKEARRLDMQPDEERVRAQIAAFEQRNRDRPQWQESREQVLPALRRALEEQSVIAQLEAGTRVAPPPEEAGLRAYYESHRELFTQPEQLRLSMILLKVDPSSPSLAWEQARVRAKNIVSQLADGADFAELARLHSGDSSAADGGDMGYRHRGTLPAGMESEIDKLALGAISDPFRLLEGVAIFRFTGRKPAQLKTFEEMRANVTELWTREQQETQWRGLLVRLRAGAEIRIGDQAAR